MKALSVQQPWAWLIVNGYKPIENRTWVLAEHGLFSPGGPLPCRIAIHASKKFDHEGERWVRETFPEIPLPESYDMGGLVGEADLVGQTRRHDSRWFFGPIGHLLANAAATAFRPLRGMLGFFEVPA